MSDNDKKEIKSIDDLLHELKEQELDEVAGGFAGGPGGALGGQGGPGAAGMTPLGGIHSPRDDVGH